LKLHKYSIISYSRFQNPYSTWFTTLSATLIVAVAYLEIRGKEKLRIKLKKESLLEDEYIQQMPFPTAIINKNYLIKSNEKFDFLVEGHKSIKNIIPNYKIDTKVQYATIKDEYFRVHTEEIQTNDKEQTFYIILLLKQERRLEKTYAEEIAIGLITIDNYQEVTEQMEEVKVPILLAVIDRNLNTLAKEVGGIVRKFEKDKFLFILTEKKLEYLKSNKFEVLEKIREIEIGNKMPVTISIGIGKDAETINQAMDFARASMNLALGRGGDQVVIKQKDKYIFFGGKSAEVSSTSRVRARVKAHALEEIIEEASEVIVMGHRNPDLDSLGAAIGIYKIAVSKGKKCKILINSVSTNINLLYDRLIENKPYSDDVFINNEEALKLINDKTLVIVVDCHIPEIVESREILDMSKNTVVIDHHRQSASFIKNPVLTYHEPYASSTCELVTELIQYVKGVKIEDIEADALLTGITVDTKSFTFKTGAKTFEAAAFLKRCGADGIRVRMLLQYDLESYKAKAIAVNSAEIFNSNMALAICPSTVENPSLTSAQVADELLTITGVKASFVISGDDNMVLISARSLGSINVQIIMEMLGGGGHQTIAGAQILDLTEEEAIIKLKNTINQYMEENK
jgi:cyclic-di-AMP phosphodiesterase